MLLLDLLDGHDAPQTRVPRFPGFAHATGTDGGEGFLWPSVSPIMEPEPYDLSINKYPLKINSAFVCIYPDYLQVMD